MPVSASQQGDWELRDGKFYRRDTVSIAPTAPTTVELKASCPNCPRHLERIKFLEGRVKELEVMIAEFRMKLSTAEKLIAELKARILKMEMEIKRLQQIFSEMKITIQKHVHTINELRRQMA